MADIKDLQLKDYDLDALFKCDKYFKMRKIYSTQGCKLDIYIWRELSKTQYVEVDDECLFIVYGDKKEHAYTPFCKEEDFPKYVIKLKEFFKEKFNQKLKMYNVDEYSLNILERDGVLKDFKVTPIVIYDDYIYDGEALRTLAGRKYSRKRNYIHRFLKEYDGRYEYRRLTLNDKDGAIHLYNKWLDEHIDGNEKYNDGEKRFIDCEKDFVYEIFSNEKLFNEAIIGGIFIDSKLAAFSIGKYNELTEQALILIEKADRDIVGLYPMMNQQFLLNEFKEAKEINREDDAGLEELREAKEQYFPIRKEKKYLLEEI